MMMSSLQISVCFLLAQLAIYCSFVQGELPPGCLESYMTEVDYNQRVFSYSMQRNTWESVELKRLQRRHAVDLHRRDKRRKLELSGPPWYPVAYTKDTELYRKCDKEIIVYNVDQAGGTHTISFIDMSGSSEQLVTHVTNWTLSTEYLGMVEYHYIYGEKPTVRYQQILSLSNQHYIAIRCGGDDSTLPSARLVISIRQRGATAEEIQTYVKEAEAKGAVSLNLKYVQQTSCPAV